MRANKITPARELHLYEVALKMRASGLSSEFITNAVHVASFLDGVYDLMLLWESEDTASEQAEILADIHELTEDFIEETPEELPYVKFNDLAAIAKDIRKFKDSLLLIVNSNGGIKELATKTGIPQPSLSRFFNSVSMPRRATLLKIAKALKLDAVSVATEWSK